MVDGTADSSVANSSAEVAYNQIDGIGPTAVIAQNGIQVSRDATANVHHNVVATTFTRRRPPPAKES